MLDRDGKTGAGATPAKLVAISKLSSWPPKPAWTTSVTPIRPRSINQDYDRAIARPKESAQKLAAFLGTGFSPQLAFAVVDPSLRRTRIT